MSKEAERPVVVDNISFDDFLELPKPKMELWLVYATRAQMRRLLTEELEGQAEAWRDEPQAMVEEIFELRLNGSRKLGINKWAPRTCRRELKAIWEGENGTH